MLAWLVAALLLHRLAPPWGDVSAREALSALPENAPATQAERLFERGFPGPATQSQLVLVLQRPSGLTAADKLWISFQLVPAIQALGAPPQTLSPAGMPPILRIRSWGDEYVGQVLLSKDRQATLVLVDVAGDLLDAPVRRMAEATDQLLQRFRAQGAIPAGLTVALTGNALVGRDLVEAQARSLPRLRFWTPAVLVLLLLAVFRRPGVVLVLLVGVFAAVAMTLDLLARLAVADYVHVFAGLEAYVVLLLLVAGIAAGRLLFHRPRRPGLVGLRSGRLVLLGGLTAIVGGGALATAAFARLHWAGVGTALGQTVLLAALLTLLPALVQLLGRAALWPTRLPGRLPQRLHGGVRRLWAALSRRVARAAPGAILLGAAVVLVPLLAVGLWQYRGVNVALLRELPADAPSLQGIRLLQEHFPPGIAAPVILLVVDDRIDFSSAAGIEQVKLLSQRLLQRRDGLPLADVRSVAEPLGTAASVRQVIPGPGPVAALVAQVIRAGAVAYYVGASEHSAHGVARLDLLLADDPLAPEMIDRMGQLRQAIAETLPPELQGAQLYLLGDGPRQYALKQVVLRDRMRLELLASLAVFVLLALGLRRPARAAGVVAAVLLSELVAMGATWLLFRVASGPSFSGISWQIPILVFLILLVNGGWAGLLLVEELGPTRSPRRLRGAVRRAGPALAGVGLALAGTFASLAAGATLTGMGQMAFAAPLALLLENWLILPLLLPAFWGLTAQGTCRRQGSTKA